jgi:hypothetical protein
LVENREITAVTKQVGVRAQNPRANGMECSAPKLAQFMSEQIRDAAHHFAGGLVGERQQQNAIGGNALFEQVRDAVGERAGLARAGAGDDERGTGRRGDGGELLGVQLARVVNLEMDCGMERFQNVITRHGAELKSQMAVDKRKKWVATFQVGMNPAIALIICLR